MGLLRASARRFCELQENIDSRHSIGNDTEPSINFWYFEVQRFIYHPPQGHRLRHLDDRRYLHHLSSAAAYRCSTASSPAAGPWASIQPRPHFHGLCAPGWRQRGSLWVQAGLKPCHYLLTVHKVRTHSVLAARPGLCCFCRYVPRLALAPSVAESGGEHGPGPADWAVNKRCAPSCSCTAFDSVCCSLMAFFAS